MEIAIIALLVSICISAVIARNELIAKSQFSQGCVYTVIAIIFIIDLLTAIGLFKRSSRLRRTMARHTFEIWYYQLSIFAVE
jgi:hypothetical protein